MGEDRAAEAAKWRWQAERGNCASCRFSDAWGESLTCVRFPPVPIAYTFKTGRVSKEHVWPSVGHLYWCGEYVRHPYAPIEGA